MDWPVFWIALEKKFFSWGHQPGP